MEGFDKRPRVSAISTCDKLNVLRLMARASGYVMVRRSGAKPFVLSEKDWLALPVASTARREGEG
jgi:hypothetical protein